MPQVIDRSALVMHSTTRMYQLVNDVEAYPEFVPWCDHAEVVEQQGSAVIASLAIAKGSLRQVFTTRNDLSDPERICMELVDGPFTNLSGHWTFKALADDACKVSLCLQFEFNSRFAGYTLGNVMGSAANRLVDAFCKRADHLYG